MLKLRDSSEVKEAASLLDDFLQQTQAEDSLRRGYRGEKLYRALRTLCNRAGFSSATLSDRQGLVLSIHNPPITSEAVGAVITVFADCMEKAARIAGWADLNSVCTDISREEKAVARRFLVGDSPYFVFVTCPRGVDVSADVELAIEELSSIIDVSSERGAGR